MGHQWKVANLIAQDALQDVHQSLLVRQVLWNRGVRSEADARAFLKPDYARDLHDPFLFNDMEKAVQRILKAIDEREHIVIHGDYDADGVCASAVLASTIEFLGGTPTVHLPHRMEDGYGVSVKAVEKFAQKKIDLLITADCGISSGEALARAHAAGIDTVIVDHHTAPETLPHAYAILHCDIPGEQYPFQKLSAGGVAFKLAQALLHTARLKNLRLHARNLEAFEKWLLDLVAISTVADVVPLIGENRTLVHFGLQVLNKTQRMGLMKLIARTRLMARSGSGVLNARNIAFHIAPRLNAAGRMKHASLAYSLLRAVEEGAAEALADELERANSARQRATETIMDEARAQRSMRALGAVTVAWGEDWSVGLVGLVAGKFADELKMPAFIIGKMNGQWTGSCRSVEGSDCVKLLHALSALLGRWGGHAQAAGFTLKEGIEPEAFAEALNAAMVKKGAAIPRPTFAIDADIGFSGLTKEFAESLDSFAPFGEGNAAPLLLTRQCRVREVSSVGSDGQHVTCTVIDREGRERRAIAFDHNHEETPILREGVQADIVYEPTLNHWNGEYALELYVRDSKISD